MDDVSISLSNTSDRKIELGADQSVERSKLAGLVANSRYAAPSVHSFPLSDPLPVGQTSMVGNI